MLPKTIHLKIQLYMSLVPFCMVSTSVQDNVVNHIALVFGVVKAERAA